MPDWLAPLGNRPLVYFTLGTVFNMESGDLFNRVLAGLHDLPINVIVTVGPHIDPAEFGPQPDHIHIERYIAQDAILPHCKLLISHGGSGSVAGSLLHGKPSVLIPMGADQPLNALRCVELGLGQMLDPIAATPQSIRAAAWTVLNTPSYHEVAQHFRAGFTTLPAPEEMLTLLEQLKDKA
jgi:MGT family glycosyltransferase